MRGSPILRFMASRFGKTRRGAQHDVAHSAEFYRQVADLSPNMLWAARADGTIDYFNRRVLEYAGRSHQQLEGWGWRSVVHPDDWERCLARWTKAFTKGQPYEVEYRLRRHDGRYLWHLGAAMPVREGSRIVRWFGTSTEIESQKRAERLLEKARSALDALVGSHAHDIIDSRIRTLLESAPVMIWQSGPDKLCTFFSKPWLDFTGRSLAQEMGAGWAEGVHPEDLERCLATYHRAFDAREPFEMEYRLRRRDGAYRLIFDRGVPLNDPVRGFLGYAGSCVDITDRHAAKLELEGHQDRLRAFMDSIPGIAWIKDAQFRYLWLSSNYSRLHGRQAGEFIGREDFEVWPEELALLYRKDDELALRVNGPVQCIERSPFADGSTATWLVVKFPLPDASGALGIAGIAFDITEQLAEGAPESAPNPLERLSGRERQVMQLIVDGSTSAEVGARLGLSPKSVDTYRSRLMTKLGVGDLATLVKFALRHGLTSKR